MSLLELLVIGGALILFIKPKDLPLLAYKIGQWYSKLKKLQYSFSREWHHFQQQLTDEVEQTQKKKAKEDLDIPESLLFTETKEQAFSKKEARKKKTK